MLSLLVFIFLGVLLVRVGHGHSDLIRELQRLQQERGQGRVRLLRMQRIHMRLRMRRRFHHSWIQGSDTV